jgi:hypothetical protein
MNDAHAMGGASPTCEPQRQLRKATGRALM